MNKYMLLAILAIACIITVNVFEFSPEEEEDKIPNEFFLLQRAYPFAEVNEEARLQAFRESSTLGNLYRTRGTWTEKGPTNVGGRITCLAIDPTNSQTIFAGTAFGGVLKSTDNGQNWEALWNHNISLAIGDIEISKANPKVIYVGTGEANGSGDSYDGDGVYRSDDGGVTWRHLGLEKTRRTSRIVIHPSNPDIVYVATMGAQYSKTEDRGVYRSTDGGNTWQKILYSSTMTGAIDLVIHPDGNTLYAAMWERFRSLSSAQWGGPTSAVWRTQDAGDNWEQMKNGLAQSNQNSGRIGLALCESQPETVYVYYTDTTKSRQELYRTDNSGESWQFIGDVPGVSYSWYFGQIRVHPKNPDTVFLGSMRMYRSTNGGRSFSDVTSIQHVDFHALEFDPFDDSRLISGNDGGVYISQNNGSTWSKCPNLPITQFYAITIDPHQPERTYGGTQDNGTIRTNSGKVDDWHRVLGGDGFYCLVDHSDPSIAYAEYQNGALHKSTNGGRSFFSATNGIAFGDRKNWNSPLAMNPNDSSILYFGTQKLYRTTNKAWSWTPISQDLSKGTFGTLTTIGLTKSDDNVIYVGTNDGNVWVTKDTGSSWTQINSGLPDRVVTRVAVDPNDAAIAYVTFSGYRYDEYIPHIFRTTDFGQTWKPIHSNLPDQPINEVVIDPSNTSRLFIGTDYGVFYTNDLGKSWIPLGTNLPYCAVYDLAIHDGLRILRAGTHGRSIWEFDLSQIDTPQRQSASFISSLEVVAAGQVEIHLSTDSKQNIHVSVYDLLGNHVQDLVQDELQAGKYQYTATLSTKENTTYFIKIDNQVVDEVKRVEFTK